MLVFCCCGVRVGLAQGPGPGLDESGAGEGDAVVYENGMTCSKESDKETLCKVHEMPVKLSGNHINESWEGTDRMLSIAGMLDNQASEIILDADNPLWIGPDAACGLTNLKLSRCAFNTSLGPSTNLQLAGIVLAGRARLQVSDSVLMLETCQAWFELRDAICSGGTLQAQARVRGPWTLPCAACCAILCIERACFPVPFMVHFCARHGMKLHVQTLYIAQVMGSLIQVLAFESGGVTWSNVRIPLPNLCSADVEVCARMSCTHVYVHVRVATTWFLK